jgi:hypothetical protein
MSNRPRDLFNLLKAVRHPLAKSFFTYAKRYCAAADNGFGLDATGASNLAELAHLISGVMLRRTKDEALDLPPQVRAWQPVDLPPAAAAGVRRLEAHALDYLVAHPARSGPTWVQFLGLLNRGRHELAVAKVKATIEAARERVEAGEKVVVFTSYTKVVQALRAAFGGAAVSITGEDGAAARQRAADALQSDPSVRVLAGNLHAAGVGLTLTAATHVLFNDLDWVPGNHWQAEDRIYRIGQTRPAFVTYLYVPETLDDFVAALLEQKAANIGVLEAEAAEQATLVQQVVDAAVRGERPARTLGMTGAREGVKSDPARPAPGRSVGLLEETLDLLARARRGLAAQGPTTEEHRVPSKSKPDEYYTVTVASGVVRCDCPGFSYRGNCSHTREIAARIGGAA